MEITAFIHNARQEALLLGDYNAYRAQCSRRLATVRKQLGRTTKPKAKYTAPEPLTAEDISKDPKYAHLLLYSSERAWAHGMHLKSVISDDPAAATSSTKSHVQSRLHKAAQHAFQLYNLLSEASAEQQHLLEALAYASSLSGAEAFEKSQWQPALTAFATARIIYSVLAATTKNDIYKEQLTTTIDPSVRYSAYQLQLPRDLDIASISRQHFPRDSHPAITAALESLDANVFSAPTTSADAGTVTSLTWRTHTTPIDDPRISVALSAAQTAESSFDPANPDSIDPILSAYADVIDTVRHSLDELSASGTPASHPKYQSLQLIFTSTNTTLITWRIRRNRQLIDKILAQTPTKTGQLKEAIALYDAIIQSVAQIKELPGVPRDEALVAELNAQSALFAAHRTAAIAQSHALLGNTKNALALYARAHQHAVAAAPAVPEGDAAAARELVRRLEGEVARWRALADIEAVEKKERGKEAVGKVLERLDTYREGELWKSPGVVEWPPRVKPVPVKPLFLDVAWNFVDYPGAETGKAAAAVDMGQREDEGRKSGGGLLGRLWGR